MSRCWNAQNESTFVKRKISQGVSAGSAVEALGFALRSSWWGAASKQ